MYIGHYTRVELLISVKVMSCPRLVGGTLLSPQQCPTRVSAPPIGVTLLLQRSIYDISV